MGFLALIAFVVIILGPVAFFISLATRARVRALEGEHGGRNHDLRDSVAGLERRIRDLELKLADVTTRPSAVATRSQAGDAVSEAIGQPFAATETPQPPLVPDAPVEEPAAAIDATTAAPPQAWDAVRVEPVAMADPEPEPAPQAEPQPEPEPAEWDAAAAAATIESDEPAAIRPGTAEPPAKPARVAAPRRSLEEAIGTRWTVWVGGLALALGAILLVRYSIERGVFGPGVRVALGFVLAAALIGAGEFLRRRDTLPAAAVRGAYIPGMLTATGTIAAFGTIYAAYALYHFIGPSAAFVALGATALGCMAAASLHGPALAGIGLAGALVTPLLTPTADPSPWPVVIYVGVVGTAAHGLSRLQNWLWLSLAAAAGAAVWAVLLLGGIDMGFFAAAMTHIALQTALAAAFIAILRLAAVPDETAMPDRAGNIVLAGAAILAIGALWLGSLMNYFGWAWLVGAAVVAAILALTAARVAAVASAIAAAGILVLAVLLLWPPLGTSLDGGVHSVLVAAIIGLFRPDAPVLYSIAALLGCGGIAVLAAARLMRAGSLPFVAAASYAGAAAVAPLGGLAIAYLRFANGKASLALAMTALAVAAAFAAGAALFLTIRRARPGEPIQLGLGALASATMAAAAFALVFALDGGMLTVALAFAAAGTAFVAVRLDIAALRWCVAAMGVLVAARLCWDPRIVGDDLSTTPIFNWLLFGYGIPAFGFALAGRVMRSRGDDVPVRVADALGVLFSVFLVFFEIRHAMNGGDPYAPGSGLLEQGLLAVASFGFGIVLTRLDASRSNIVFRYASLAAGAVGMGLAVIGLGLRWNPLLRHEPVEGGVILNALVLSYLMPGLLAGLLAYFAHRSRPLWYWAGAGAISLALCLAYLMLEVRLLLHGQTIAMDLGTGLAELGIDTTICLLVMTALAWALGRTAFAFFEWALVAIAALASVICVLGLGLAHNPLLVFEPVAGNAIINTLIPGYLLPALMVVAFAFVTRPLRPIYWQGAGAAGLALALAYLVLEVRVLFNGASIVGARGAGIAELGIDTAIFIAVAITLMYGARTRQSRLLAYGALAIAVLALGVDVVGLGLYANPLFTFEGVAGGAVLNTLLVGYGLPAALAFALAREVNRDDDALAPWAFRLATSIAAIAALFVFATLETRRIFQGDVMLYLRPTSETEWYAYSAVWLLLGVALLAYGVWRHSRAMRLASAVFVLASVAKVFLFDLRGLEGILRAASFIGLGIALIGIGLAYQKLRLHGAGRAGAGHAKSADGLSRRRPGRSAMKPRAFNRRRRTTPRPRRRDVRPATARSPSSGCC